MTVHLIKLCVGCPGPEVLFQEMARRERYDEGRIPEKQGQARHITRSFPRRAQDVLDGGSLYWVMSGFIRARQPILALEEATTEDGTKACAIVFSRRIMLITPTPRRPFQGWRYFPDDEVPEDLGWYDGGELNEPLPLPMLKDLADIGIV